MRDPLSYEPAVGSLFSEIGGRPDTIWQATPAGGAIGFPSTSRPRLVRNHIDGPVVHFRNGELHWLTVWERILLLLGRIDAYALEQKHRPMLAGLGR